MTTRNKVKPKAKTNSVKELHAKHSEAICYVTNIAGVLNDVATIFSQSAGVLNDDVTIFSQSDRLQCGAMWYRLMAMWGNGGNFEKAYAMAWNIMLEKLRIDVCKQAQNANAMKVNRSANEALAV